MKKKIIALLMVLCIVCSGILFAGCSKSPYDTVDAAIKKTAALDTAQMKMDMKMNMAMEGMTLSIPLTADIKGKALQSDSPVISMDMDMSVLGQSVKMSMYQEGEWSYISTEGMKYKTKTADLEGQYDYANNASDIVKPLPKELYTDAKVTADDKGMTVEFELAEDEFNKYYSDFLDSADLASQMGGEIDDIKLSDAKVTISVKDGYVVTYAMKFKMELKEGDNTVSADVDATVDYKNPGNAIEVNPPEDYKSYEELDMSDLLGGDLSDEEIDFDFDE